MTILTIEPDLIATMLLQPRREPLLPPPESDVNCYGTTTVS